MQHCSERRSATGTREGRRSQDLRWFSQVEDLSFTALPILCFPWDQQGPGSAAVFPSCPIYLLSLDKIHSKWFSQNFFPSGFSIEFRLWLTKSSGWVGDICIYILLFLPGTRSDGGGVLVIPSPQPGTGKGAFGQAKHSPRAM